MVMSWNVVVHGDEEIVRLYCPTCWNTAKKVADEFKAHLEEKYGDCEE